MLALGVQHSTAVQFNHAYIYIYIYIKNLPQFLFSYIFLQTSGYRSLCYTGGPCWLSILCILTMGNRETVETVSDFIFGGSKITADGDCHHEIKRCLLLGRKVMTNLDSILKSRDITLPTKVHLVKAMVFPVVMYGCESWTIKKAEH